MDNSPGEAAEEAVGSNHAQHMPHASYGQSGKVITPTIQDDTHSTDDIKGPDQPAAPQAEFAPSTSVPVPVSTTLDIPAVSAPPPPPAPASPAVSGVEIDLDHPLAVSEVYSTYGMEYILMFISLAAS